MSDKVSIILATYNAEEYICYALDSIINQIYTNWECLIIDGVSNDSTINIVKQYAIKDSRIRFISEKDNGIYDAFNKGWKHAKGEWIYYLGSDDRLTKNGLGDLMHLAETADYNIGVVNGGVFRVSQDGKGKKIISKGYIGSHQGMVMRRTAIEELGGFNLKFKIIADYDLFIRMKNSHWGVLNTDAIVAYFKAGGTSEKFSSTLKVLKEKITILKNDKQCKSPFLVALIDSSKTILGGLLHNSLKVLK